MKAWLEEWRASYHEKDIRDGRRQTVISRSITSPARARIDGGIFPRGSSVIVAHVPRMARLAPVEGGNYGSRNPAVAAGGPHSYHHSPRSILALIDLQKGGKKW
jgi:hypothetical protein